MNNPIDFTDDERRAAEIRAIRILLFCMITTHPRKQNAIDLARQTADIEEHLLTDLARSLPGDSAASVLTAINGRMTEVRETIEAIISGSIGPKRPGL